MTVKLDSYTILEILKYAFWENLDDDETNISTAKLLKIRLISNKYAYGIHLYDILSYLRINIKNDNILDFWKKHINYFENAQDACKNAHAIAIMTEWDEFKNYDWQKIYDDMQKPAFVFDGRNLLDKNKLEKIGFVYQAIGS